MNNQIIINYLRKIFLLAARNFYSIENKITYKYVHSFFIILNIIHLDVTHSCSSLLLLWPHQCQLQTQPTSTLRRWNKMKVMYKRSNPLYIITTFCGFSTMKEAVQVLQWNSVMREFGCHLPRGGVDSDSMTTSTAQRSAWCPSLLCCTLQPQPSQWCQHMTCTSAAL